MDRRSQNRLGILLVVLSVVTVVGLFAIQSALGALREQRDPGSDCLVGQFPPGHIALLADKTDGMTERQIAYLERERDRILADVRRDELVSVYVIDASTSVAIEPVFSLCSPGSEHDANPLYQNPRRFDERFQERFGVRFEGVIDELKVQRRSPQSPILEAIRGVATSPEFGPDVPRRELVIVSDLLQNVPEYSHYSGAPDWGDFQARAYAEQVAIDLAGIDVRVIYLRRSEDVAVQSNAHLYFWDRYFQESGAASVEILRR